MFCFHIPLRLTLDTVFSLLEEKEKKKLEIFAVDLDCLAKVLGLKQTLSGLYTHLDISSFDRSADLDDIV